MEHIQDPIRPSDSDSCCDETYLHARDPSILAYSQRVGIKKPDETKKNLLSSYGIEESMQDDTSGSLSELSSQTVKVYLRLKPFLRSAKLTESQEKAYQIMNSHTLLTQLPVLENATASMIKSSSLETVCRRYIFTETFGPEVTQFEFFEQAIKSQMSEFISGQNCTIMTYGTTNSGKSYTLQGTTTSPGIIPRGLEFVFANINPKSSPSYKPMYNCDVMALSSLDRAQELDVKYKLLNFGLTDRNQYIAAYKQMQKLLEAESPKGVSQPSDANYSVWVSFAEIYNETIYDLLSNDCQKRRPALKLATDSNGRAFIKGLKTICVNSGSEAFQVLMAGQYNLKVAATALNSRSSRSHCIFTIKLLKYYKENDPDSVEISTFAFCDLAGSERLKKTLNVGERLKEAQNINTSLLVLGRCLKSIYEGQSVKNRNDHVGPFRESKLTRLFQRALSGKEPISLIVNVNPSPNLYIETQNVLNFAAIAKKIILQSKKVKRRKSKSRFSQVVEHKMKSIIDWDDTAELESIPEQSSLDLDPCPSIQPEDYEDLLNENEKLRKEISTLKSSALNRDFEIRQQMANTYSEMLKKVEDHYKNQLRDAEEQQVDLMEYNVNRVETYWKEKLNQVVSRKRSRSDYDDDYDDDDDDIVTIAELEAENTNLTSKVTSLKATLKNIRKQYDSLESAKNTAEYELSLVKEDLKRVTKLVATMQDDFVTKGQPVQCIEELQKQLADLNEKNKILKDYLNEAKQDYIDVNSAIESKDQQIQERDNMIILQTEKLQDLESQFENANSVLSERIRYVDELEEKLERQAEQIIEAEQRIVELEDSQKSVECIKHEISYEDGNSKNDIINELREKLKNCEIENSVLLEKSSKHYDEIKTLKIDLDAANKYISELDTKLNDLEIYRNLKAKSSQLSIVQSNIEIKTEQLEYCDSESQTMTIKTADQINQTNFTDSETENLTEKLTAIEKELAQSSEDCLEKSILIEKYEKQIDGLTKTIDDLQHSKTEFTNTIEKLKDEANVNSLTCQTEHIAVIETLKEDLLVAQQSEITNKELIDKYRLEFDKLELKLCEIQCLQDKISDLDCKLKKVELEKAELQNKLQDNLSKIELNNKLFEESTKKIQDKDEEILRLQKEIKTLLQSTVNDESTMEKEFKKVLKELDDTKQIVQLENRSVEQLKNRIKELETIDIENYRKQIVNIQNTNKILQASLDLKDRDMEQFKQNRDKLIEKYEKSLEFSQEELNILKRENTEFKELLRISTTTPHTNEKNRKFCAPSNERIQYNLRDNKQSKETDEIAVIELSESESKRTTRGTATRMVTSEKKSTRKKKLYTQGDDSYTDIIPLSEPSPSPVSTRSLRTRRKNK